MLVCDPRRNALLKEGNKRDKIDECKPVVKPLMATTSFDRTRGVLDNYLIPAFGKCCLHDLTALTLQTYFSKLTTSTTNQMLSHEARDKIRDVLSSALRFAVQHDLLVRTAESLRIPPDKRGKKRNKPYLTPQQFELLVELIPERVRFDGSFGFRVLLQHQKVSAVQQSRHAA